MFVWNIYRAQFVRTLVSGGWRVIALSTTALANLAYLIGAVVVAVIGGFIVWLRHRQPKSVDANMASFRRGLSALAPEPRPATPAQAGRTEQFRIRPVPAGLAHVRRGPDSFGRAPRAGRADGDRGDRGDRAGQFEEEWDAGGNKSAGDHDG